MLIQFAVENYLSFRDRTVFSLAASPGEDRHPCQTCPGPGDLRLLRCGAIYGANAAGKSNLIKAMQFAQQLILKGTRPGEKLQARPFKLSTERKERSRFEFDIAIDGLRHAYGFSLERGVIAEEWLYQGQGESEALVFEREGTDPIRLGDLFAADRDFISFVARGTRPEQLFLTELEERNVKQLAPLQFWFRERLRCITPGGPVPYNSIPLEAVSGLFPFISEQIYDAGTGIREVRTERRRLQVSESMAKQVRAMLRQTPLGVATIHHNGQFRTVVEGDQEYSIDEYVVVARRHLSDETTVDFEMDEESDGTKRYLDLLPTIFLNAYSSEPDQRVITVIDEIERSLHPLLTRRFLEQYLAHACTGGQLIYTTHDTNLLDLSLLRADEIWFAEKDLEHATRLYSLAEFKADQLAQLGSHLEQGYLNGRFGAIPFFGTRRQLGISAGE